MLNLPTTMLNIRLHNDVLSAALAQTFHLLSQLFLP